MGLCACAPLTYLLDRAREAIRVGDGHNTVLPAGHLRHLIRSKMADDQVQRVAGHLDPLELIHQVPLDRLTPRVSRPDHLAVRVAFCGA